MGTRENKVETYLHEEVTTLGGTTRKWVSPQHVGVPDRIVIISGMILFVEVKTFDGSVTPEQDREHKRLRDQGATVFVVYGKYGEQGVTGFIEQLKKLIQQ